MRLLGVALLLASLALAGCKSVPTLAGLATGGAAGAATASPAVGYAIGLGVRTATAAGLKYANRVRQGAEQDAISAVAGTLSEGDVAAWRIRHDIPIGNERGMVRVTRLVATPLAECRDILFTVEDPPAPPAWYTSSICRRTRLWKWAQAEPAVERWGFLQ